jgi:hypothetical protein
MAGGTPVVVAATGGMPVVDATAGGIGLPVTVASNGYGIPVTLATNGYGTPVVFTTPLGGGPVPGIGTPPAIADVTPTAGETLTCSQGTWTNSPTSFAYQWFYWTSDGPPLAGTLIPGATSSSYGPLT